MFRKILAPLNTPPPLSPPKPRRRDLRGKENHPSPHVSVSEPTDFRLVAHVECDPNTGLYKGIDEFMTLAVLPRGRKSPQKPRPPALDVAPLPLPAVTRFPDPDDDPSTAAPHSAPSSPVRQPLPSSDDDDGDDDDDDDAESPLAIPRRLPANRPSPQKKPALSPPRAPDRAEVPVADAAPPLARNLSRLPASPPLHPVRASAAKPPRAASIVVPTGVAYSRPRRPSPGKASVSRPFRMKHEVHVRLDPENPTGFAGLPGAWETILMYSGILRDEAMANPEVVIDVLNFSKKAEGKRSSVNRALPPICLERMNTPSMTSFDERSDGFLSDELTSQSSGNSGVVQLERFSLAGEELVKVRRRSSQYKGPHLGPLPPIPTSAISHVRRSEPVVKEVSEEPTTDVMENLIGSERKMDLPDGIPDDLVADFREDDPFKLFTRMEQIGQGSCGNVYRAVDKDGRFVALKKVKPESSRDWKLYKFEVKVMQDQYKSDNLVDCYDAFKCGNELWIVMEYVSAGTLADLLSEQRASDFQRSQQEGESASFARKMEESVIAYICREVLRGLDSLHSIRRVHRDIKGDNILLDMDGSVKIADFGFCAELSRGSGKRNTVVGTPYWMAPEVIRGANYDCKVDMWSAGILALECAEGKPPHLDASPIRAMFLIATQGAPELSDTGRWSDSMREFIGLCCRVKAGERPSAEEALKHRFIAGACSQADAAGFFAEACDLRFRKRRERRTRGFSNYQFQTES